MLEMTHRWAQCVEDLLRPADCGLRRSNPRKILGVHASAGAWRWSYLAAPCSKRPSQSVKGCKL